MAKLKGLKPASHYDAVYNESVEYRKPYKDSRYFVHWTQVYQFLKLIQNPKILDIGCGTGQFAAYLEDEGYTDYLGVDFSEVAIQIARETSSQKFVVGDASRLANELNYSYDTVICLEVLEHIDEDLKLLQDLPPETNIIFSVPKFDAVGHVRYFVKKSQVRNRYYSLIDIEMVTEVAGIYICRGIVSPIKLSFLQKIFRTRKKIGLAPLAHWLSRFPKRLKMKITTSLRLKHKN